jgi:molybdopterin/thiamine biosynthesis adenylyltransferase
MTSRTPPDPTSSLIPSPASSSASVPSSFEDRYSRQILFPGIGERGQKALAHARVAIIGVGATGATSASLLARAGVGHITLIDRDFVEPSNLQRQILFDEQDAADSLPKAEAARRKLLAVNSSITVIAHIADLVPANIHALLGSAHLLLDATDNFETRYLLNDFAVQRGIPWIYAAAVGAYAATMTILPRLPSREAPSSPEHASGPPEDAPAPIPEVGILSEAEESPYLSLATERSDASPYHPTACLACIFPKPPTGPVETCDTAGILSTAVNLAASLQVTEALKILTGQPHLLRRSLVSFDLWQPTASTRLDHAEISAATPRPGCEVCDLRHFTHLAGTSRPHITLCGRDSVQIHEHHRPIDLAAMQRQLANIPDLSDVRSNSLLLRFRRGPFTLTIFADGRALIHGTTDVTVARSLYARFLGT